MLCKKRKNRDRAQRHLWPRCHRQLNVSHYPATCRRIRLQRHQRQTPPNQHRRRRRSLRQHLRHEGQGKVIKQTHGTGTIDISYITPQQKTKVTTTIKDGSGTLQNTQTRTVEFDSIGRVAKVTDTFGNETRYTRNSQTWVTREEQWENTGTVANPNLVQKYAAN